MNATSLHRTASVVHVTEPSSIRTPGPAESHPPSRSRTRPSPAERRLWIVMPPARFGAARLRPIGRTRESPGEERPEHRQADLECPTIVGGRLPTAQRMRREVSAGSRRPSSHRSGATIAARRLHFPTLRQSRHLRLNAPRGELLSGARIHSRTARAGGDIGG